MKKILIAVVLAVALAAVVAGIAVGASRDEEEPPITGTALERASGAALAHVGGGRVSESEAGDEDGAYEVEVTLEDGTQVDVHLDASFDVLGDEPDDEGETDDD